MEKRKDYAVECDSREAHGQPELPFGLSQCKRGEGGHRAVFHLAAIRIYHVACVMLELLLPDMESPIPGCLRFPRASCQVVLVSKLFKLILSLLDCIFLGKSPCSPLLHMLPAMYYVTINLVSTGFHGSEQ